MITRKFNYSQLATSVMCWLGYTSAVGRNYVLSEGSIKYPVAEYLEWLGTDQLKLEYGHPKLFMKRFDLFFKNNNEKKVFEFKYIMKGSTGNKSEKQRVFNDLMRLHLYLEKNQKGIFLICGDQFQFNTSFQKQLSKPAGTKGKTYINPKVKTTVTPSVTAQGSGFYTEWFSFDRNTPKKIIDIKNPKFGYKSIYKIFLNDYKKPFKKETGNTLRLPDKITTNLVFLSEDTKGTFQPTKIGIWEIIKTN